MMVLWAPCGSYMSQCSIPNQHHVKTMCGPYSHSLATTDKILGCIDTCRMYIRASKCICISVGAEISTHPFLPVCRDECLVDATEHCGGKILYRRVNDQASSRATHLWYSQAHTCTASVCHDHNACQNFLARC